MEFGNIDANIVNLSQMPTRIPIPHAQTARRQKTHHPKTAAHNPLTLPLTIPKIAIKTQTTHRLPLITTNKHK